MRINILARRFSALSKATSFLAILSLATACSNDVMRLDALTTASVHNTSNQSNIIGDGETRLSNYNEEFEPQQPQIQVAPRNSHIRPQGSYSQPGRYASLKVTPPEESVAISRSKLPAITASNSKPVRSAPGHSIVLQPRQAQASPLRVENTDQMTTSSTSRVSQPVVQQSKSVGWDDSKGAQVTVRPGETLYNLSRRYGVPVSAIMKANQIKDANNVEAGRKILIPTYNYSNAAPVSAPDSDPITKASRASRGFQGQARGRVAVPKARIVQNNKPVETAELSRRDSVTGEATQYVVKSGDTLSGIAYRTGVSMAAIRQSNSMSDNTVRLGQSLTIPGAGTQVDHTKTGSVPAKGTTKSRVKPTRSATAETVGSISPAKKSKDNQTASKVASFRWPAEGRVISKFGERSTSGTNDGIDISMPVGTPVKASQNGTVIYAGSELEDFGNLILVSHSDGWVSAYAHSSANLVSRGQKVTRGQMIAKSGRSGNATVPKLHFELRKDSNPVNPLNHLDR